MISAHEYGWLDKGFAGPSRRAVNVGRPILYRSRGTRRIGGVRETVLIGPRDDVEAKKRGWHSEPGQTATGNTLTVVSNCRHFHGGAKPPP
jgi:hypothetical protein